MSAAAGWVLTMLFVMFARVLFRAPSFDAALRVYEGLFGFAPLGDVFKWRAIAIAAVIACLGPTAWSAIQLVPPHRWVAVGFAAVLMAVLGILLIGGSAKVSPDEPPNPC